MAHSKTEIFNLALGHLAISKQIADAETEKSSEALICRRFYPSALEKTLRDFDWPFATRYVTLAELESPTPEWCHAYQYPTDVVKIRRILSGRRVDHEESQIPYRTAYGDTGEIILTDKAEAVAECTALVTNTARFHSDFVLALSALLSSLIAPSVTKDSTALGERAIQLYTVFLAQAR